jgi:molecular chaperone HtpG
VKGVVDSEDLPLNISRETMQDSALVKKLNSLLTKRFIKQLAKEAKSNPAKHEEFFERFSRFLKEGIAAGHENHEALAGLLRFESSLSDEGKVTSFEEYLTRAKDDQESIYYLSGIDRKSMEAGPYVEAFQKRGIEVIFLTDNIDDYIMETLGEYKGKKLVSANRSEIELDELPDGEAKLSEEDSKELIEWLTKTLGGKVESVAMGKRLVSHPVVALTPQDAPNGQMRAMMEAMGQAGPEPKARLEFNPNHEIVSKLNGLRKGNEEVAAKVADQLADNALMAAGLVKDPTTVIAGMNALVNTLMK